MAVGNFPVMSSVRESTLVCAAFLTLHLALLLNLIGLGTPRWSWRYLDSSGVPQERSVVIAMAEYGELASQGLWMVCVNGSCVSLSTSNNIPGWVHWAQGLFALSSIGTLLGLVLFYWFYLTLAPWPVAYNMLRTILISVMSSCICMTTSVMIYGIKNMEDLVLSTEGNYFGKMTGQKFFGWTYYLVVTGCALALLTCIELTYALNNLRRNKPPYMEFK